MILLVYYIEYKDSKFPSDIMFYRVQNQELTIDTLVKLENTLEYKAPKNPVLVTTCRYVFDRHLISVKNENNLKVISCVAHNDCIFIMG